MLDLRATAKRELREVVHRPVGLGAGHGVLPAAAVFGANASGKSTLIMAANFLRIAVLRSASEAVEGQGVLEAAEPFRFDVVCRRAPICFRISFLLDGMRHEYGLQVRPRQDDAFARVSSEWLRTWPSGHPVDVFLRGEAVREAGKEGPWWVSEQGFTGSRRLAADLFEQTREDVLFVSLASARNQAQAKEIVAWFTAGFRPTTVVFPLYTQALSLESPRFAEYLSRLLKAADTGIEAVKTIRDEEKEQKFNQDAPSLFADDVLKMLLAARPRAYTTNTWHRDSHGNLVPVLLTEESHGTQQLFALAGPLFDVLEHGRCLWVDELHNGLHHWILRTLIKMFQSPEINPKGAQLIFTTHDAAVMDPTLLRRDQIWIVEKDAAQGSQLFSLADIEDKPRKDQPLYKSFLSGRFGGVPRLDEQAIMNWSKAGLT